MEIWGLLVSRLNSMEASQVLVKLSDLIMHYSIVISKFIICDLFIHSIVILKYC